MPVRRPKLAFAGVALSVAALAACSDGGATDARRGTLRLSITDAPFPFDSVAHADIYVVRIDGKAAEPDSVEAERGKDDDHQAGELEHEHGGSKGGHGSRTPSAGATPSFSRGGEDNGSNEWVTLATPNAAINLLDLQNGKVLNLGEQSLPTGEYRGFRLVIDAAKSSVTLKDGTKPDIKWPSAGRSGIKVRLERPISITAGGTQMVLDFDLGHSFELRGKSISQNGLVFKPVIRAVARDATGTVAGSVHAGTASGAAVSGAAVELWTQLADTATAGSHPAASAATDASGQYKLAFVLPGTYGVRVVPPAGSANKSGVVPAVTVKTGATTTQDVVLP